MLDLRQLVCAFLAVVGAASLFGGYRLFADGAGAPSSNAAPATFFAGFGALLIVLAAVMTIGPWRARPEPLVFPIGALDLNAPPAAIEKVSPPPFPPPLPALAANGAKQPVEVDSAGRRPVRRHRETCSDQPAAAACR